MPWGEIRFWRSECILSASLAVRSTVTVGENIHVHSYDSLNESDVNRPCEKKTDCHVLAGTFSTCYSVSRFIVELLAACAEIERLKEAIG
jgi:hypothetical protein